MTERWWRGLGTPWLVLGALTLVTGLLTVGLTRDTVFAVTVVSAIAVAISGRSPVAGLLLAWSSFAAWLLGSSPVPHPAQFFLVVVAFACGLRGRPGTVAAAALSVPLLALVVLLRLLVGATPGLLAPFASVGEALLGLGSAERLIVLLLGVLGMAALELPLLLGLSVRWLGRSRRSEQDQVVAEQRAVESAEVADHAQEIARLRGEQARLARDVHDVVGHSLTVVVAQAEAAQYAGDDPAVLRTTLQGIADTARTSLDDVRTVLAATRTPSAAGGGSHDEPDALTRMVSGLRSGGVDVRVSEEGTPRPLPPELATVAHRVTQEMLTNATRHGRSDQPVHVERHWDGDTLRIDVRNSVAAGPDPDLEATMPVALAPGSGLTGMRSRLEAVGGHLDVRRRDAEQTFTTTAWVPLRPLPRPGEQP